MNASQRTYTKDELLDVIDAGFYCQARGRDVTTFLSAMQSLGDHMAHRCGALASGEQPRDEMDRACLTIAQFIAGCNGAEAATDNGQGFKDAMMELARRYPEIVREVFGDTRQ